MNLRKDPYAFEKLKVAAETAKKNLSVDDEVEIRIPGIVTSESGEALSVERRIGQDEFSSLVMDLVMRTFKVCDEALQNANLTVRDLDGVILVGGPTRLPLIRKAVGDYFQKPPRTDIDPDEVVAKGAAIHAASLTDVEQGAYLLDVTPLSLRIGVAGGLAETVIERNTPVPIEQTRTFTTFQDFQERVKIRVYQGESRQADGNEMLGQFEFAGFRKARRGEVEIDVTFSIDSDGLVLVTACDRATGQQASTEITLSSGLSEAEIEDILERGDTDRVHTATPEEVDSASAPHATPEPELDGGLLEEDGDELDELETDDDDALELMEGVETPPAELRGSALDMEEPEGAPDDPVPLETPAASAAAAGAVATADDDAARDAYLGDAGEDLTAYVDRDEPESK
jgi:molecular chaperone DnaK